MLLCHGSVNIVWHLSQAHEYDIQFCIIIHQRWYNQRQGATMMFMSGNELLHIAHCTIRNIASFSTYPPL
jgi:hypothetical protein